MAHERPPRTLKPLVFDAPAFCCDEAERFAAWTDTLVSRLTKDGTREPTTEQMYEAKAKLVDEYRKERNGATKAHRDRLSDKAGDPCIHGVFIATLERLAEIRVQPKITPPPRSRVVTPSPHPETRPRPKSVADALAEALKDAY
jgi:hypothetical protein